MTQLQSPRSRLRLRWSVGFVLSASLLCAQSLDPNTRLLLDHAKADRDLFGAGHLGGFSLEDQVKKSGSDIHFTSIEDNWIAPEATNSTLVGTQKCADLYLGRMLKENDIAVIGTVNKQLSILNANKSKIVTDSLLDVNEVLHLRAGFNVQPGDQLIVTRPGGRMHIDGHQVQIDINGFSPFFSGKEYLLFLSKNQSTGSYTVQPDGAFLTNGNDIWALYTKGKHPAAPYLDNKQAFSEKIRNKSAEVSQ